MTDRLAAFRYINIVFLHVELLLFIFVGRAIVRVLMVRSVLPDPQLQREFSTMRLKTKLTMCLFPKCNSLQVGIFVNLLISSNDMSIIRVK